ncbi:MAG: OmcA/MtrC family decaheme c-type cytochrome, partial [Wenzhouxiangella sp.]
MKSARSVKHHRIAQWVMTAFALFALSLPQAWGSVEENQKLLEFLDGFPAEMIPEAEESGTGSIQAAAGDGFAGAAEAFSMDGVLVQFRERPAPEKLYPVITGASFSDTVTVEFDVLDQFGQGVPGLQQGQNVAFSFTVNKLIPGSGGETDNWTTYVRGADEGVADAQGTTYSSGALSDLGGGSYSFTFADSLESISDIAFEPELTHRVGMEIRNAVISGQSVPGADTAFDIQPSTGATTGIRQREIIVQEDCAACHGSEEFAFHGGARQDVRQCVSCHQPGSFDVGSGNTIDFRVMIHKIHTGANLTQPFEICGRGCEAFGQPPSDFSEVHFPQSTQNCVACHDPANPATPQAINVANAPTAATCASCHDGLSFDETGLTNERRGHPGLAQPNSTCAACHSDNGLMTNSIEAHFGFNLAQELSRQFRFNILDVMNTGEGDSPSVLFSITDPTNDDQPYDLANDAPFTGSATSIAMVFAWPNEDFSNIANIAGTETTGRPPGQPVSVTLVGSGPGLPGFVFDNGDGTYTATLTSGMETGT